METITITLPIEQTQETLIALRGRALELSKDLDKATSPTVREIIARQQVRVALALCTIAQAVGE